MDAKEKCPFVKRVPCTWEGGEFRLSKTSHSTYFTVQIVSINIVLTRTNILTN